MLGKTRTDRIHNTKVREILKLDEIQDEIEDSKIRWYGHVKRMNAEGCQYRQWNIDWKGRDKEVGLDIGGKNKLRRMLWKEELNG